MESENKESRAQRSLKIAKEMHQPEIGELIVDAIIYDLKDRRGLKREWGFIQYDVRDEIKQEWIAIVTEAIKQNN